MELNHNSLIFLMLFILFGFFSCKRFVEIPPPSAQLVNSSVFASAETATGAQISLYSSNNMQQESYNMSLNPGLLSDELGKGFSQDATLTQYYRNSLSSNKISGPWITAYNYIYQVNSIIEGLYNNKNISDAIQMQLTGESKFIRAYWHFYLTNCYGDIPLITSTDYKINSVIARSPRNLVYEQIVKDLEDARNLLNSNFVDASDTASTSERVRPTKWAAAALLSRVFLYTGKYDSAEILASSIIAHSSLFDLTDSLDDVFLKNSKEAIWQLATPLPTSRNTYDGDNFILVSAPLVYGTANVATISSQLLNAFEYGDKRKQHWIGSYTDLSGAIYYFPFKYKKHMSPVVTEYTMMLRLAEQYLIRAEARANNNDLAGAVDDLNKIRKRAGLLDYNGDMSKIAILTAVLQERRVELFVEWGHRWFDLIRTHNIDNIMPGITALKGGSWETSDKLYPIPQSERIANPNLTQNDGY